MDTAVFWSAELMAGTWGFSLTHGKNFFLILFLLPLYQNFFFSNHCQWWLVLKLYLYNIIYMWNLEKWQRDELIGRTEIVTDVENKHCYCYGEWDKLGLTLHYTALLLTNKNLLLAQGALLNYLWWPKWEGH